MREKLRPVWLLAKRELRDQLRDWRLLFPLLFLTFIFPPMMNEFAGATVSFINQYGGDLIIDRLVPFSVLIIGFFPITISLVVALESFVGEKERRTIEPLLSTPFRDWQIYVGKLLVGISFPLVASYLSIGLYLLLVSKQDLNLPAFSQILQLLALTAVHAILMVSGALAVSTQSTSVRAANLLASFIVIPTAFLIQGESALLFWGNGQMLWLAVIAVLIVAALIIRVGLAHFQREHLLGREVDTLNFRWMLRTFWDQFRGEAKSPFSWYRNEIPATLRRLMRPILAVLLLTLVSGVLSYWFTSSLLTPVFAEVPAEEMSVVVDEFTSKSGFGELAQPGIELTYSFIFGHNVQAVLVMLLLGLVSFGVLGGVAFVVNIGFLGAVLAFYKAIGYSTWAIFTAGILPHGIFEIPAIIFTCATILYFGAILVTPNPARTMGDVFLRALGDWAKIAVGIVLPLLAIAAAIETFITPQLLAKFI